VVNFRAPPVRWVQLKAQEFEANFESLTYWDYFSEITYGINSYENLVLGTAQPDPANGITVFTNNVTVGSSRFQLINTGYAQVSAKGDNINPGRPAPLLGNFIAIFEINEAVEEQIASTSGPTDITVPLNCDLGLSYSACETTHVLLLGPAVRAPRQELQRHIERNVSLHSQVNNSLLFQKVMTRASVHTLTE
jgi:hypothetical protein